MTLTRIKRLFYNNHALITGPMKGSTQLENILFLLNITLYNCV